VIERPSGVLPARDRDPPAVLDDRDEELRVRRTARQRTYGPLGGGTYTPQAVVDGQAQLVGSKSGALEQAIVTAGRRTHAAIELAVTPARGAYDVTVKVGAVPGGPTDAELFVAIVQDRGRVAVPRGENAGRTLDHVAIARSVKALGPVAASGGGGRATIALPPPVSAPDGTSFSAVAFVQERSSRHIAGSASIALTR